MLSDKKVPTYPMGSKGDEQARTGASLGITNLSLEGRITKLRLTYLGHIMQSNCLEKAVMLRMTSSQRTGWLDTIKANINQGIEQLKEVAQD